MSISCFPKRAWLLACRQRRSPLHFSLGLRLRQNNDLAHRWGLPFAAIKTIAGRYLRPAPRLKLRRALLAHARASMDISDGLAKDLGRMARASGCGAQVRLGDLPISEAVAGALTVDDCIWQVIVSGGDDHELLVAVPRAKVMAFEAAAAFDGIALAEPSFAVACIGEMTTGAEVEFHRPDGSPFVPEHAGWDHF